MINEKDGAIRVIFAKYDTFVKAGGKPRVILIPKGMLSDIEDEWMDVNDINYKKKDYRVPCEPDAIIFGIMAIEVDDIKEVIIY
jgi:hypothetical protein